MKLSFKFLPLLAFAVFAGFSASALEAKFVSIEGKVEILEGGMWIPVEEGDIIQERGAVISTGFKSNAVVSVKGTNFTLGPLTRITIENMVAMENKDSTQIYIDSGSLKANVSSSDGRKVGFKVRSAVATASVRGTEFKVTSSDHKFFANKSISPANCNINGASAFIRARFRTRTRLNTCCIY